MGVFGIGVYQPIAQVPAGTVSSSVILGSNSGGIPGVSTRLYQTAVDDDLPIAYFPMNEKKGPILDASGHGYQGNVGGSPTFGVPGALLGPGESTWTGVQFPGNSSSFITLSSSLNIAGWKQLTLECFAKLTTTISSGSPRLLANAHSDEDNTGIQLFLQTNGCVSLTIGTGSTSAQVTSISQVTTSGYTHILASWDGQIITMYINGRPENFISCIGSIASSPHVLHLGQDPAYSGDYFAGSLCNLAIYNRALDANDALFHFEMAQSTGATVIGDGFVPVPTTITAPGSGIYGGSYGYVIYTTIRAPKNVQWTPAQSIGNDNLSNPVIRGFPQMVWNYSTLRPDYWYYLRWLYKLSGQTPAGYQYLVCIQYPDRSGNNTPVQQLARWDPPVQSYRTVGAFLGVQLKFTYIGQAVLAPTVPLVTVTW